MSIQQALFYCQKSLKLRIQLNESRDIGLSYNTIGQIYRDDGQLAKANRYYEQAREKFNEVNDKISLADALRNLGYSDYLAHNYDQALDFIEQSRDIFSFYNIEQELLNTFNKLGRVHRRKGNFDLAEEYQQKALKLARQYRQFFIIMDSLVEFCRINYARSKNVSEEQQEIYYEKVYEYERQLRELGENHLAWFRLELVLGDMKRDQKLFGEAIIHWGKSFAHIARRNRRRFEFYFYRLNDRLQTLPNDQIVQSCNQLIAFWNQQQLAESFPEVIDLCESEIEIHQYIDFK